MSAMSFNCRGMGGAATVKEIRDLAKIHAPTVLFVLETQLQKAHVESLARSIGFDRCFAYHIDVIVKEVGKDPWRLTGVYGEAQTSERFKTWDMLKFIRASSPLPWEGKARNLTELQTKIEAVTSSLRSWGSTTFGSVRNETRTLREDLKRMREDTARVGPTHAELKTVERLTELAHREEIMWRQRSRVQWLAEGDKNTRFFHLRASQRKRKNKIERLRQTNGEMTDNPSLMASATNTFYKDLYRSEGTEDMEAVLDSVPVRVTEGMNEGLIAAISNREVKEALFQMFPTKAPGPDGLPAHFFQRHWGLCGGEVTEIVLRVLRGEDDPAAFNKTFIVLIPKVPKPEELGQFRPISLCNVIYKIASKVLANRLKQILPAIISDEQSAFVPGRLITDNIITAYECLHFMKRNKAKKHRFCALKLDMRKAYDRVEWEYLRAIMLKLGFHTAWVNMVMRLVTSVSFSVLFNGERLDEFTPSRGIRQGDPISPYLFLLAAEGMSCLLKTRSESSHLQGLKVAASAPAVNHLLFADDSLLFINANGDSARDARDTLDAYCRASGQRINLDKSSIFFSKKCPVTIKQELKDILNVQNETLSEKYLGMPSNVGRSTSGAFKFLKDRIWKRIQGWIEQCLSAGGKDVLIKAVLQAIPIYSMACFKLPQGLCQHIDSLIRKFWWGSKDGKRKTCWVAWEEMTKPKSLGGLGFRDIELFNLALLARQGWRILKNPDTLSARVLKAVYFPGTDFLKAELGSHPSKVWRSIMEGKEVLAQGLIRRIGTGATTHAWFDNWIPRDGALRPVCSLTNDPPSHVADFIVQSTRQWNLDLLNECFTPMDVQEIKSIPISTRVQEDFWAWHYEKKGIFSVRSAYLMLINTREKREAWLENRAASSNAEELKKCWSKLWHIQPETKRKGTPSPSHPIWIPPPGNWAKINVDAGVARSGEHGVVAAVARSASGVYLGGSAVLIIGISNPEVLEALAVREGLNLAQDLLLTKVRLASDCLSVINALKEENWGSYSQILQEIKRTSRDLEELTYDNGKKKLAATVVRDEPV
ncbi:uncharacterized protein [Lolium perenne]|uniref:uncharacterized protein n=1 Tax=Lolium perenne TaxID=4522 RepID=UPI003A98E96A